MVPTCGSPVRPEVLEALLTLAERLDGAGIDWALTGSLGHALQGVPVEVDDIDVQTDASGACAVQARLAPFVTSPVAHRAGEQIRSHFGEFRISGVAVEVMGAVQKRRADGTWEPEVDVAAHRAFVRFEGRTIPVLKLEYESTAYAMLGRNERARLLGLYADRVGKRTHTG